jgi:xanthine dehydrogenase accessory factor
MRANTELTNQIRQILELGRTATLATVVQSSAGQPPVGAKMGVLNDGETFGGFGDAMLDEYVVRESQVFLNSREASKVIHTSTEALPAAAILFERIEPEPRLVIAGAGHVGAALARLGAIAGFRITLIDDRADFVDRNLFSTAREESIVLVQAADWRTAMHDAMGNGRGVFVAIVTRGHKQDEECLRAVLTRHCEYVGMIGSKRRTNIVLEKLREEGTDENELKKVRAPIGLDIGAVSPEEVALAILAEIVAERRGGPGVPLSSWRRG